MSNDSIDVDAALERVRRWLRADGDIDSDRDFVAAITRLAEEWHREKSDGMDVVASAVRDELAELVEAMDDLI